MAEKKKTTKKVKAEVEEIKEENVSEVLVEAEEPKKKVEKKVKEVKETNKEEVKKVKEVKVKDFISEIFE